MNRSIVLASAAMALATSAMSAQASCGGAAALALLHGTRMRAPTAMPLQRQLNHSGKATMVGLWHAVYTDTDGNFVFESLDTWHSDGTEIEDANVDPRTGNMCVGAFSNVGPRTVQEFHTAWTYDDAGNQTGTLTINATNKVNKDNSSYDGTFDFRVFDLNGNLLAEVTGTEHADRITSGD